MADDDKKDEQELSEDEKLAAEWEAAMDESGDGEGSREDEWAAAMAEAEGGDDQPEAERQDVRTAPMEEFGADQGPGGGESPDIDVILDIPVTISMEVGNTQIPIRNLLHLS